ncbi:MAG: AfsA-related hotdog domain-containing protein [Pseudonocardiaceae bacterium]
MVSAEKVDENLGRGGQVDHGMPGFLRTVDRRMVHRAAVSEVFLTDVRQTGEGMLLAEAQLPLTHGYYSDHVQDPATFDPLLLLEAARQASIYGAHLLVGIPPRTAMIVERFSLQLAELGVLRIGHRPGELRLNSAFEVLKWRGARPRNGRATQRLFLGDELIGDHQMDVMLLSPSEHDALRQAQRSGPALSTADMADLPHPAQVAEHLVGRVHPMNVVLADARRVGHGHSALVSPRFGNRALFDHEYDHLPALILTEAARQLVLLVAAGGPAGGPMVAGIDARFFRFAELDAPLIATTAAAGLPGDRMRVPVVFTQMSTRIAEVTVTLIP